jgi:SPOR domain
MARSHAATNNGWPRQPSGEQDPRNGNGHGNGHGAAPGQHPGSQITGYPVYEEEQQAAPGYDPQYGYHYPQHQQHPQQAPAPQAQRGLSSLDRNNTQQAPDYPAPQPGYGQAQPQYGQGQQPGQQQPYGYGEPNGLPGYPQQSHQQAAPGYDQWAPGAPQQDPNGYDLGGYHPSGQPGQAPDPLQPEMDWAMASHAGYGELAPADAYPNGHLGYEQPHAGALEQAYAHEEAADYNDAPKRGSWLMRIAGAIVVAVGLGYGLAQGYKLVAGGSPDDASTPVVRGDGAPARSLPADPGGRQFSNTDAKVMGRLGDGGAAAGATGSLTSADSSSSTTADGTRRVKPLVIRPDGSIVSDAAPESPVNVPGVTVIDGFGGGGFPSSAVTTTTTRPPEQKAQAPRRPAVITPPASSKPVAPKVIARAEPAAAPAVPPSKPASAPKQTSSPPAASSGGANGYVVVLASVPASGTSRLSALKKFADMQQQYGSVLQSKTPDVKEANLGAKGTYHRLLVGPPGSRTQASSLCQQLKTAGYKDCWVTAY